MSPPKTLQALGSLLLAGLSACGGGQTPATAPHTPPPSGHGTGTPTTTPTGSTGSSSTPAGVSACVPSGRGRDYQVGPGTGQLAALDQVPWESLQAGDTVRIFYRAAPYAGKFMLSGVGTAAAPIRVCGVRGPAGQRPVVEGRDAVSRRGLAYGHPLHESRSLVVIKPLASSPTAWTDVPAHLQIDGLELRGAQPDHTFTDSHGVVQRYAAFGACVWIERGHHISLVDNHIHDCSNGVFSKSTDDGDFAVTRDLRIAHNQIEGNGVVQDDHEHNVYIQSVGVVYEGNWFGPLRAGALGNLIKDRSVGTVIRYNALQGGAHAIDLVESEDFYQTATADPAYRQTLVYGNLIRKNGEDGSAIHYGGDHYGSSPATPNWGEPIFRKGTLYFYHNSVHLEGQSAVLFQLSTTEEHLEAWNNVLSFAGSVTYPALRSRSEVNPAHWTAGGTVHLGKNWVSARLADADPWHPVPGTVTGWSSLLRGDALPYDPANFVPLAAGALLDAAQPDLSVVAANPVRFQYDLIQQAIRPRAVQGAAADLGAVER
jgi:hypothetical protein